MYNGWLPKIYSSILPSTVQDVYRCVRCATWRPDRNQCLWCLKKGHRLVDCRSKANGEPSRIQTDGSRFEDFHKGEPQETESCATQCFKAQTLRKNQQSWLVDSGCNRHMTPFREDVKNLEIDDTLCRFGESNTSRAEGKGRVTTTNSLVMSPKCYENTRMERGGDISLWTGQEPDLGI